MKQLALLTLTSVLFLGGCGTAERSPARTEATTIIACEAAHITIQAAPSGRGEGEWDQMTEKTDGSE